MSSHAFDAARRDDLASLLGALDAGFDPSAVNQAGDSLVMLAACHGHAEVVRALLSRGADPSRRNDRGQAPLDGAAFLGKLDVIAALLDGGAEIDAQGETGKTALMWAAAFERSSAVSLLLERGADASLTDREGFDARGRAEFMRAWEVVRLFESLDDTLTERRSA